MSIPIHRVHQRCYRAWKCCPSWTQVLLLFVIGNVVGDLVAFPLVHTFWNIVGFEGWFIDE